MADPATRIVSLTITEGGYNVNQATGQFDDDDPRTSGATSADRHDPPPRSATSPRRSSAAPRADSPRSPSMSCDNIQGNGDVARRTCPRLRRAARPELGGWIDGEVAFPNSMVDRITPVTTDADRALARGAVRGRRRLAGGLRAVHPVGARGPLPARPPRLGAGRRAARLGRRRPTS